MSYPLLQIRFLGTGTSSGVPMVGCDCRVCTSTDPRDRRLRSSVLVVSPATTLCVDAGPDFRYQMLREKVMRLDAIVFTHPHKDHIAGLDDVRGFNYFSGRPMEVFANEMTQEVIIREFPYAFADTKYPGVPEIHLNTITDDPFAVRELQVIPVQVMHLRMPVFGFRFGNFTYITDANRIDEEERKKIRGSEVLVLNALRREKHISHFNLEEAVALIRELQVPKAYLTHISHQLGLHEEVNRELPEGIELAYDGLVIEV